MGIAEDLVLLAVNPRSGRFTVTDMLIYALRSAQLADLVVAGLVTVDDGRIEITEKVKRPLPFEESVAVDAIKRLREQTVDQWMSKTSRTLEMNYVRSLDRQGAVELDPKWYKYQFLSGQRATAVDQVRYDQVLARVDRVARGEIPPGRNLDLLISVFPALAIHHLLIFGELPDASFTAQVMNDLILPLAVAPL